MFARQLTTRLLCCPAAVLQVAPASRSYSSAFGRPLLATSLHAQPSRLDKKNLPFYMQHPPQKLYDDPDKYSEEEKYDRQELIDKIIAMADNNVAPGVKEFEEVLQLVVKYKDLHGIDVLLKAAKEKGHYDNLNEELVDKAYGMMEA